MTLACPKCGWVQKVAGMYFDYGSGSQGKSVPFMLKCIECDHRWEPKDGDQVEVKDEHNADRNE